jgi:UDP-N-acetylmuramate dehydrogenase
VGGVKISEQHGNFFINDQKATWRDIITLRDQIKNVVREKYNIELHEEVRIIYNNIHHVQV